MKETVSILCVLVAAIIDVGNANYFSSFHDIKHLQLPHQNKMQTLRKVRLATSWRNCGSASDPIQMVNLHVTPDVVRLPGEFVVTAEVQLAANISAPLEANVSLKRKTFLGWLTIPCVGGYIGSCDYHDVCALSPYSDVCPPICQQFGLPCHCPITQGTYKVANFPVTVKVEIPHWLESGKYKAEIRISEAGQQMGCYEIDTKLN